MGGRTYRTRLALRLAVASAAIVWAVALAWLVAQPGARPQPVLTALLFLAFFVGSIARYQRLAVVVRADRLVVRGALRERSARWDEIERVEVLRSLWGTIYTVRMRAGRLRFTSQIQGHRELLETLLERARLQPAPL